MEVRWMAFTIGLPGWPGRITQGGITVKKFAVLLSAGALALSGTVAQAQTRMFVRGTIASLGGDVLSVKSRDGKDLKINLAPKFGVRYAKALTLADIKPGDFVGPASRKRADGSLEAISLQVFTPDRRGQVPEGHTPWDLEPGSRSQGVCPSGTWPRRSGVNTWRDIASSEPSARFLDAGPTKSPGLMSANVSALA